MSSHARSHAAVTVIDKKTAELKVGNKVVELEIPNPQQNLKECNLDAPKILLELEWVYGYRGRDARKTMIFVHTTEELAYCCGTTVVLYHDILNRQRHYRQHTGIIHCMAVHPVRSRGILATGQEAKKGKKQVEPAVIHIWKAETLDTLQTIGSNGEFHQAIIHLSFSQDELSLCAVSSGNFHVLSVWNWQSGERVAYPYESENPIFDIEFNPVQSELEMWSFGRGQLFSWRVQEDGTLRPSLVETMLLTQKKETRTLHNSPDITERKSYFTCFTFAHDGDIVVGDSEGSIHIIPEEDRTNILSLCSGSHAPIQTIQKIPHGRLVSGNCDGWVALWDKLNDVRLIVFELSDIHGALRNAVGSFDGRVFASTTKNVIININSDSCHVPIVIGHAFEVNGLCSTTESRFVTCGKDKRVIMWDALRWEAQWISQIQHEARCAAVSASKNYVAVGCYSGHWVLMNAQLGHRFNEGRACYDPIECIGFSPVDTLLAMGARSGEVFIFVVTENNLTPRGKLKMPTGPATHMDFSIDSQHLRTCSNDRKIYYWALPQCREDDSDHVKYDHYWWTKTCTTAYLSAGIWKNAKDLSDVNCSGVPPSEKFIASGHSDGSISIFRYPCSSMKCKEVKQKGHGSKVNSLAFLKTAMKLISVGGNDCTIFQWKLSIAPVNLPKKKQN